MAFTTTMLSWSVLEFGGLMSIELQMLELLFVGLLIIFSKSLLIQTPYVQVGDANKDHACWERPEDMDTPRTVYKIDSNNLGSDVAAETAAALAAASLVFRRCDPSYSKVLLKRAMKVFDFADRHRGSYSDRLKPIVCPFYCLFSGYQDELLWGASWLHKATRYPTYLNYIQVNGGTLGPDETDNTFGWDNKHVGARILLSKAFLIQNVKSLHEYKGHADNFICTCTRILILSNPIMIQMVDVIVHLNRPDVGFLLLKALSKVVYSTISILGLKSTKLGLRDFISVGDLLQIIGVAELLAMGMPQEAM